MDPRVFTNVPRSSHSGNFGSRPMTGRSQQTRTHKNFRTQVTRDFSLVDKVCSGNDLNIDEFESMESESNDIYDFPPSAAKLGSINQFNCHANIAGPSNTFKSPAENVNLCGKSTINNMNPKMFPLVHEPSFNLGSTSIFSGVMGVGNRATAPLLDARSIPSLNLSAMSSMNFPQKPTVNHPASALPNFPVPPTPNYRPQHDMLGPNINEPTVCPPPPSVKTQHGRSATPDGNGSDKYPSPNIEALPHDTSLGLRFDANTGLFYDDSVGLFYNCKLKKFLYWDVFKHTYLSYLLPIRTAHNRDSALGLSSAAVSNSSVGSVVPQVPFQSVINTKESLEKVKWLAQERVANSAGAEAKHGDISHQHCSPTRKDIRRSRSRNRDENKLPEVKRLSARRSPDDGDSRRRDYPPQRARKGDYQGRGRELSGSRTRDQKGDRYDIANAEGRQIEEQRKNRRAEEHQKDRKYSISHFEESPRRRSPVKSFQRSKTPKNSPVRSQVRHLPRGRSPVDNRLPSKRSRDRSLNRISPTRRMPRRSPLRNRCDIRSPPKIVPPSNESVREAFGMKSNFRRSPGKRSPRRKSPLRRSLDRKSYERKYPRRRSPLTRSPEKRQRSPSALSPRRLGPSINKNITGEVTEYPKTAVLVDENRSESSAYDPIEIWERSQSPEEGYSHSLNFANTTGKHAVRTATHKEASREYEYTFVGSPDNHSRDRYTGQMYSKRKSPRDLSDRLNMRDRYSPAFSQKSENSYGWRSEEDISGRIRIDVDDRERNEEDKYQVTGSITPQVITRQNVHDIIPSSFESRTRSSPYSERRFRSISPGVSSLRNKSPSTMFPIRTKENINIHQSSIIYTNYNNSNEGFEKRNFNLIDECDADKDNRPEIHDRKCHKTEEIFSHSMGRDESGAANEGYEETCYSREGFEDSVDTSMSLRRAPVKRLVVIRSPLRKTHESRSLSRPQDQNSISPAQERRQTGERRSPDGRHRVRQSDRDTVEESAQHSRHHGRSPYRTHQKSPSRNRDRVSPRRQERRSRVNSDDRGAPHLTRTDEEKSGQSRRSPFNIRDGKSRDQGFSERSPIKRQDRRSPGTSRGQISSRSQNQGFPSRSRDQRPSLRQRDQRSSDEVRHERSNRSRDRRSPIRPRSRDKRTPVGSQAQGTLKPGTPRCKMTGIKSPHDSAIESEAVTVLKTDEDDITQSDTSKNNDGCSTSATYKEQPPNEECPLVPSKEHDNSAKTTSSEILSIDRNLTIEINLEGDSKNIDSLSKFVGDTAIDNDNDLKTAVFEKIDHDESFPKQTSLGSGNEEQLTVVVDGVLDDEFQLKGLENDDIRDDGWSIGSNELNYSGSSSPSAHFDQESWTVVDHCGNSGDEQDELEMELCIEMKERMEEFQNEIKMEVTAKPQNVAVTENSMKKDKAKGISQELGQSIGDYTRDSFSGDNQDIGPLNKDLSEPVDNQERPIRNQGKNSSYRLSKNTTSRPRSRSPRHPRRSPRHPGSRSPRRPRSRSSRRPRSRSTHRPQKRARYEPLFSKESLSRNTDRQSAPEPARCKPLPDRYTDETDNDPLAHYYERNPTNFVIVKSQWRGDPVFIKEYLTESLQKSGTRFIKVILSFQDESGGPYDHWHIIFHSPQDAVEWYKTHNGKIRLPDKFRNKRLFLHYSLGNWKCPQCNCINFTLRSLCYNCYSHKTGGLSPIKLVSNPTRVVGVYKLSLQTSERTVLTSYDLQLKQFSIKSVKMFEDRSMRHSSGLCLFEMDSAIQATELYDYLSRNVNKIRTFDKNAHVSYIVMEKTNLTARAPRSTKPDGLGDVKYPLPDSSTFLFEPLSNMYYDPNTKLYYNSSASLFYNDDLSIYLYYDKARMTYERVES